MAADPASQRGSSAGSPIRSTCGTGRSSSFRHSRPASPCRSRSRCALGLVSVVVAAASWRLIEEPFRRGRVWIRRPRLVLGSAVSAAVAVAVLSIGIGDYSLGTSRSRWGGVCAVGACGIALARGRSRRHATRQPSPQRHRRRRRPVPPWIRVGTRRRRQPRPPSPPTTALPPPTPQPTEVPNPWPLPAVLRPALIDARSDKERIIADGCFMSLKGTKPPECVYGNLDGDDHGGPRG